MALRSTILLLFLIGNYAPCYSQDQQIEIPDKTSIEELLTAGMEAFQRGDLEKSVRYLEEVTKREPENKQVWNELGNAYTALNRIDEAKAAYRKQIEIDPYHEVAYANLAAILGNTPEGEELLRKQIEVSPFTAQAYFNLAFIYFQTKRFADARDVLVKAIKINPEDVDSNIELGTAYLELGEKEKARETYAHALSLPKADFVTYNQVAFAMADDAFDLDHARELVDQGLALINVQIRVLNLDNLDRAKLGYFNQLANAWDTIGLIELRSGHTEVARKYFLAGWQLNHVGSIAEHLGQVHEQMKQVDDAKIWYSRALASIGPSSAAAASLSRLKLTAPEISQSVAKAKSDIDTSQILSLPNPSGTNLFADCVFSWRNDGTLEKIIFLTLKGGSQKIVSDAIAGKGAPPFPDGKTPRILRRAKVTCRSGTNVCTVGFMDAADSLD